MSSRSLPAATSLPPSPELDRCLHGKTRKYKKHDVGVFTLLILLDSFVCMAVSFATKFKIYCRAYKTATNLFLCARISRFRDFVTCPCSSRTKRHDNVFVYDDDDDCHMVIFIM